MKLILMYVSILYFQQALSIDTIHFPESQTLGNHVLNMIETGQVVDNGYTFTENDLYVGRIDHVYNFQEKEFYFEIQMAARCNLAYQSPATNDLQMYYLTTTLKLDSEGRALSTNPSLSFDSCSENRERLDNSHIQDDYRIEFKPNPKLISKQADLIDQHANDLIESEQIQIYGHTFSSDEIDLHSMSLVEYIEPKIKKIVLTYIPTCYVTLEWSENLPTTLGTLYVYLMPDLSVDKVHATFGKDNLGTCKNSYKTH